MTFTTERLVKALKSELSDFRRLLYILTQLVSENQAVIECLKSKQVWISDSYWDPACSNCMYSGMPKSELVVSDFSATSSVRFSDIRLKSEC